MQRKPPVQALAAGAAGDAAGAGVAAPMVHVGCRARVCSDRQRAVCGLQGRVAAITGGMATLEVEPARQVVTVLQADLVPLGHLQDPKALHARDLTFEGKMQILYEVGWDAPRAGEDKFEPRMKELEGDKAVMLTVDHLQTWWCYLKDAFATELQKKSV